MTRVIITGDKEVTRMLNALGSRRAREIHRKAMRLAAQPVLAYARGVAPVISGDYRRSLTIRAMARSRKYQGVTVTQKPIKMRSGKMAKAFYGAFLELGWTAGGVRRRVSAGWSDGKKTIQIDRRIAKTRKVPARWLMRNAGKVNESRARRIYLDELRAMIDREAK